MAFPFLTETGWEQGTTITDTHFAVESDSDGSLDVVHYTTLAAIPGMPAPYRGAYCLRSDLSIGSSDAYLQETDSWDIAVDGTMYFRFMFWFGGSPVMVDTDIFGIFQLWSATNTPEVTAGIQYTTANGYRLFVNEAVSATGAAFADLSLNAWHSIEIFANIDLAAPTGDGTIDVYLDGNGLTQITGLTQAAITSGVIGVLGQDAGTTKGICLFSELIADDGRIFPPYVRFPQDLIVTVSGHAFLGPGILDNVSLLSGNGTDCVLTIYDTDTAVRTNHTRTTVELKNTTANEIVDPAGMPIHLIRGCYVDLTGTTPRAILKIRRAIGWGSDGAVKTYASKRKAFKQDT